MTPICPCAVLATSRPAVQPPLPGRVHLGPCTLFHHHPPSVCDLGALCRADFSAFSILRLSLDVPERPALRGARQRRTPAPMSARRCRHRPGPPPSRSARPTILSPDALEGRQRRKRRFSRPRRAGARCPNRDLAMPREPPSGHSFANDVFYRSCNRRARKMAQKTGQKRAQRKSDIWGSLEKLIFLFTRRRPVADTASGVGPNYFSDLCPPTLSKHLF